MGLQSFAEGLLLADGPVLQVAGFGYPTRMAVMALPGGGLFVWSPVALPPALRQAVEALGPVRHVVAPNHLHHLFMADWQAAFPGATFHAAPGLRAKRPDLRFDADLGDSPAPDWAAVLDQVQVPGCRITTETVFFHRPSQTAIFTDLLQQFPPGWFTGWRALVARLDMMEGAEPAVPRKFRLAFTRRRAARGALRRILDWPVERVLMAHGAPVTSEGGVFLRRAFGWLKV